MTVAVVIARSVATNSAVVARLDRAIQYAEDSRIILDVSGILGHPVKPGDDTFFPRIMINTAATSSSPMQP
jgi:hypothetical protein